MDSVESREILETLIKDRNDIQSLIQGMEKRERSRVAGDIVCSLHGFVEYDFEDIRCTLRDQRLKDSFLTWLRHEKAYLDVLIDNVKNRIYWE